MAVIHDSIITDISWDLLLYIAVVKTGERGSTIPPISDVRSGSDLSAAPYPGTGGSEPSYEAHLSSVVPHGASGYRSSNHHLPGCDKTLLVLPLRVYTRLHNCVWPSGSYEILVEYRSTRTLVIDASRTGSTTSGRTLLGVLLPRCEISINNSGMCANPHYQQILLGIPTGPRVPLFWKEYLQQIVYIWASHPRYP
eukprot:2648692-Rhodomonas_salina.1